MVGRRSDFLHFALLLLFWLALAGLFSGCDLPVLSQDSAVISWTQSTSDDVEEYRVYYGTTPGVCGSSQLRSVQVPDSPNITPATSFVGLAPGVYYFAVSAVDAAGNESECSEEVSKEIH